VNQHCYLEILARLREAVHRRRSRLWPDAWLFHHDNAFAHDVLAVREFLAKKSIMKLDHPPYSPDLAFQNRSSRNVLSSGNTDSVSVLVCKESTLKVSATICM
jgi:hypothetical protein